MIVADASSSLSWFLENPLSADAERTFNVARKSLVVIPALWLAETQNALLKLVRQRKIVPAEALGIRTELDLISKRIDVSVDRDVVDRTWEIASTHMMTYYDACYVELAWRLNLPLATDDRAGKSAARALGIKLV